MRVSALEKKLLNLIQEDIPLSPQPFKTLAKNIGITEEKLLKGLKRLKARGIIRDYAARLNHKKLGFASTLLGLKVATNRLETVARQISAYPEVTHCFQRRGKYNLWVVFIYQNGKLKGFLNKISKRIGNHNILNLETQKKFKLETKLKI